MLYVIYTPKHVGAVKGISNAFGCLAGFFANVVVGLLSHAASTNEGEKESFNGSEGGHMKNINIFTSSFIILSLFQMFGARLVLCILLSKEFSELLELFPLSLLRELELLARRRIEREQHF